MNDFKKRLGLLSLLAAVFLSTQATAGAAVFKLMLVGDSTTIGNLPREVKPEGPHLEQLIEQLAAAEGMPALEVVNTGKGGETAKRLLGSKWYKQNIEPVQNVDFIILRMGINDWFRCDDFNADFPVQMKALIGQLHEDHAEAEIILATICRFMSEEDCTQVNDLIRQIAREEGLKVFDVYTPYNQYLLDNGPNALNVRQLPLKTIPEKYHEFLKPYTSQSWWKGDSNTWVVKVNDISLDPVLGHIEGWYDDRHPNSTGYNLIAVETVNYLDPILRAARTSE